MSKTTVVIPNYNGIKYIDDCLASLYQGSAVPEIIVVDNGSTDGSLALVREKYGRAQVISFNENTGFSKAVNAGIRAAQMAVPIMCWQRTEAGPPPAAAERLGPGAVGNSPTPAPPPIPASTRGRSTR